MKKVLLAGLLLAIVVGCASVEPEPFTFERFPTSSEKRGDVPDRLKDHITDIASRISTAIEPRHPEVRIYALQIARQYPAGIHSQIGGLWLHLKRNWRFVHDPPGSDHFAPASETIKAGLAGDCDDFAILLTSLIEVIGGQARIVLAVKPEANHAYCEVWAGTGQLGGSAPISNGPYRLICKKTKGSWFEKGVTICMREGIGADEENPDVWLNLDALLEHPGARYLYTEGEIFIYPNGIWKFGT